MPEAKRPDPRRRSPASRPTRPGKSGDGGRAKPRATSPRREARGGESRAKEVAKVPEDTATGNESLDSADVGDDRDGASGGEPSRVRSIRESIVASAEAAAEQRFGSTARRAAILAAVVCVLTLTIAGPVRTYFAQRTEMKQLQASEEQLRAQIADLEAQKGKLADPVFIAAQARERLGFVLPGEIPYQVQLPAGVAAPDTEAGPPSAVRNGDPWYTSLWHTIADAPHGISPVPLPPPPPGGPVVPGLAPPAPGG